MDNNSGIFSQSRQSVAALFKPGEYRGRFDVGRQFSIDTRLKSPDHSRHPSLLLSLRRCEFRNPDLIYTAAGDPQLTEPVHHMAQDTAARWNDRFNEGVVFGIKPNECVRLHARLAV